MRLRNIAGSRERIVESPYCVPEEGQGMAGRWRSFFPGQEQEPLHLEIGMGKGRFLYTLAQANPRQAYIGIEKYSSVLLRAIQRIEAQPLDNLRFLRMDAEDLEHVFAPGEVGKIYLNFSDPWPKDRHAKRRLPSREFLARYRRILPPGGIVEFKTDNRPLFTFALEELEASGWELLGFSWDLHRDGAMSEGNVMTEYEERFSSLGQPIFKYVAAAPLC